MSKQLKEEYRQQLVNLRDQIAIVSALSNHAMPGVADWCLTLEHLAGKFDDSTVVKPLVEVEEKVEVDTRPPLVMHPAQLEHHQKARVALETFGRFVDRSGTGEGKTLNALELSKHYDHLLVVHPAGLGSNWRSEASRQGVAFGKDQSFSWHAVGGTKNHGVSHKYLERKDVQVENATNTNTHIESIITPTPAFLQLLAQKRVLVVLDEVQDGTNGGARTKASAAIATALFRGKTKGPFRHGLILLSATLMWNKAVMTRVMQLLGYLPPLIDTRHRLFTSSKSQLGSGVLMQSHLVKPFEDFCRSIDDATTTKIHDEYIKFGYHAKLQAVDGEKRPLTTQERADAFVFHCFLEILSPVLSAAMVNPNPPTLRVRNLFAMFTHPKDLQAYQDALRGCKTAVDGQRNKAFSVDERQKHRADGLAQVHRLEFSKGPLFVRLVSEKLREDPTCKVHVAVNYTDSLKFVSEGLAEFKPMVISGDPEYKMTLAKRTDIIQRFQASEKDKDGQLKDRLLIANMRMIGQGVNLDDTTGNHPRWMYAGAMYHILLMKQWEGRGARRSSKGVCNVVWLYGRPSLGPLPAIPEGGELPEIEDEYERKIMVSLADKSDVLGLLADEQVKKGMVLFDKYDCWQEWKLGQQRRVQSVGASSAVLFEQSNLKAQDAMLVSARPVERVVHPMCSLSKTAISPQEAAAHFAQKRSAPVVPDQVHAPMEIDEEVKPKPRVAKRQADVDLSTSPSKCRIVAMAIQKGVINSRQAVKVGCVKTSVVISSGTTIECCHCSKEDRCETQLQCPSGINDWQRARNKMNRDAFQHNA